MRMRSCAKDFSTEKNTGMTNARQRNNRPHTACSLFTQDRLPGLVQHAAHSDAQQRWQTSCYWAAQAAKRAGPQLEHAAHWRQTALGHSGCPARSRAGPKLPGTCTASNTPCPHRRWAGVGCQALASPSAGRLDTHESKPHVLHARCAAQVLRLAPAVLPGLTQAGCRRPQATLGGWRTFW